MIGMDFGEIRCVPVESFEINEDLTSLHLIYPYFLTARLFMWEQRILDVCDKVVFQRLMALTWLYFVFPLRAGLLGFKGRLE